MNYIDLILEALRPLDYLFILLSAFIVLMTLIKGFIRTFLGLLTWFGSILITIHTHTYLNNIITDKLSQFEGIAKILPIDGISI